MTHSTRRILAASLAGTAIEFYDFYIYATAATLVFGALYFPKASATAQMMSAYATFALAFIARPVGSVVFGHFGDRIGRKSTLVAALMVMGGSTVAIGLLPTYQMLGWGATLLLCILRFGQGFGLGGEWGGASLLAVENAPAGFQARFGMCPQFGASLGFLIANGLFLLLGFVLPPGAFVAWGWRLPFLLSAVLVVIGLWVRLRLAETPAFRRALAEAAPARVPFFELLRHYPQQTFGGIFSVVGIFALFYLITVFALGYGTKTLGYGRETFLSVELIAILFLAAGTFVSGFWADRKSARLVMIVGSCATFVAGILLEPALGSGNLPIITIYLSAGMFALGLMYGPLGSWLPDLFPARVRYTGSSIAFNVGGILGGALTPILAEYLVAAGGLGLVGAYLCGAAAISIVAMAVVGKKRRVVVERVRQA